MEPLRSTRVTWVMAAVLGTAAIVLDTPSLYLAAFSLVLFSAALAIRFRRRMHRIVASARITRSADSRVVPQGGSAAITTEFSCSPVPGILLRVRDVLPPAAQTYPANATAIVASDGSAVLHYNLIPLVPGSVEIEGTVVTVADPFYSASLVMASAPFRGLELTVHPHPAYERLSETKDFTAREKDTPVIFRGSGIRAIREYLHGDDLRFIDWKMTAKHDRMFVREYAAAENLPPLIVLDLPDRSFPVPDDRMAHLVSSVTGEALTALRNCGSVSLFLISGVNVVDVLLNETGIHRVTTLIRRSAHPQVRLHHAYRWKNRAGMRGFIRKIGSAASRRDEEDHSLFLARIAQIYKKSLASPDVPLFPSQVKHLLHSLQLEEIILYSFFEGDLSHVRELAFQAKVKGIRLRPRTVGRQEAADLSAVRRMQGMDTLEVVP